MIGKEGGVGYMLLGGGEWAEPFQLQFQCDSHFHDLKRNKENRTHIVTEKKQLP